MNQFTSLGEAVIAISIALPRLAAAFLLMPFLTKESMPALVRNVLLVSLAMVLAPLLLSNSQGALPTGVALAPLIVKELFLGAAIGFSFGIVFWALEGAGQVIDAKVGTNMAQLADPVTGHQSTPFGTFLARLAAFVFVSFGGLQVFLNVIMSSYAVWPVHAPLPDLAAAGQIFFVGRFDALMAMILLVAAPALLALTLIEAGFGFVNRYAEQLNVFSLSMSLKAWMGVLLMLLMTGVVVEFISAWIRDNANLLDTLQQQL